jgi:hypothetical protein
MIIQFKRACAIGEVKFKVGHIGKIDETIATDLIQRGKADQYKGQYPPKKGTKMKFNLKQLI